MPKGYVKECFEDIPGNESNTTVLSTKVMYPPLQSFAPRLSPDPLERDDEMRGIDEPVPHIPEAYAPAWESRGRVYPDVLGWRLKHIFGDPVTTAGDGIITDPAAVIIPTGCKRHVWTAPFGPSGASPQTIEAIIAYIEEGVFFKMRGAACSSLGIESPDSGGVTFNASGPALYMTDIANPSLTPAGEALTIRPFVKGNLTLPTWLTNHGEASGFSLSIENPVEARPTMGASSLFPDQMLKANEGPIVVRGSVPFDRLDVDDWKAVRDATGFAAMAQWVSPSIIASSYPYKFFVEMENCQYVDGEAEELANRRRHGAEFNFKATTADGAGSAKFTLVNATASYA